MAPKRELFVATGGDGGAPPPEKRPRAEAAPGGSRSSPEPPSSPKHFMAIVLVVLFLKRPKGRSTDPIPISASHSQPGLLDQIFRFIKPLFSKLEAMDSKLETVCSKVERIDENVQDLTMKLNNITKPSPNHQIHEDFTQEINQDCTTAEAERLATTEVKDGNSSIQLRFLNGMKTQVYHDEEIKSDSNTTIKIGIFDGEKMIESGGLSNLQIEIFALEGDFPHTSPKNWTAKKFNKHRAKARDGKGDVLAGEGTKVQLKNGQCELGSIKFTENSSKARKSKFIVGARVCEGEVSGVRVQEAVMNPVTVQDRRNKTNKKSHLPMLSDRVHCLKKIAKDGIFCKRLEKQKILTVRDFLKTLNKDPDSLANILQIKKEHKSWEKMVEHARKCSLKCELKSHRCSEKNVVLFFDCVDGLVGAEFGGCYISSNMFNQDQQDLVDELKGSAYDGLDALRPDHVMTETANSPQPLFKDIGSGPSAGPSYMPNDCSCLHAGHQVGGVPAGKDLSCTQIDPSVANTNVDMVPSSSIPDHQNSHQYQGTWLAGQEQFSSASLNGLSQEPVRRLNSSSWRTEELYHGDEDDGVGCFLNQAVAPEFNQVDIQSRLFWLGNDTFEASTSSQCYMMSTPQQPTFSGAPASAQGNMQSQMQAPFPSSNDASVASASAQQALPPQEWSPWNGPF